MLQPVGIAAGCGLISALLYLLVTAGGIGGLVLAYLAPLPLFAAGLWLGRGAVAVAAGAGLIATAALSENGLSTFAYALTVAVPAVVLVRHALLVREGADGTAEWYPAERLLSLTIGMALAGLLAAVVLALGEADGLEGVLRGLMSDLLRRLAEAEAGLDADALAGVLTSVVPGLTGVSWIVMMAVNGLLAQALVKRFGVAIRPTPRLRDMELPGWLVMAFAAILVAAFLPDPIGFVASNAAMILGSAFLFAGLSVIHAFAHAKGAPKALLIGFYAVVFLLGWPVFLVIGLGLIEQWMGLRRRWSAAPHQGDE